jgi:adenine phosphoribosyltransferase
MILFNGRSGRTGELVEHTLTICSDLIATGGSAAAAGELIKKAGGETLEYLFIVSLPFLKGGDKLDAPMYAMIEAED